MQVLQISARNRYPPRRPLAGLTLRRVFAFRLWPVSLAYPGRALYSVVTDSNLAVGALPENRYRRKRPRPG